MLAAAVGPSFEGELSRLYAHSATKHLQTPSRKHANTRTHKQTLKMRPLKQSTFYRKRKSISHNATDPDREQPIAGAEGSEKQQRLGPFAGAYGLEVLVSRSRKLHTVGCVGIPFSAISHCKMFYLCRRCIPELLRPAAVLFTNHTDTAPLVHVNPDCLYAGNSDLGVESLGRHFSPWFNSVHDLHPACRFISLFDPPPHIISSAD